MLARRTGTDASGHDHAAFRDAPHEDVLLMMITSGTGADTGFAIGEETIAERFAA